MVGRLFRRMLASSRAGLAPATWQAMFVLLLLPFGQAFAEGSRTLFPNTVNPADSGRGVMDLSTSGTYAGVARASQFLYVYAKKDEYILLGSSNVGTGTGQGKGDIFVYNPQSFGPKGNEFATVTALTPAFKCSDQAGKGIIASRAQELSGPSSADLSVVKGYAPCFYKAPTAGVYGVRFTGATANTVTNAATLASLQILSNLVSAWDVTVRATIASADDLNARLFSYVWNVYTNGNGTGKRIYTNLYYTSTDGYRYNQALQGLDPNEAAFYANASGFLDTNGSPLYRDYRGTTQFVTNGRSGTAGVTAQSPQYPLFFSNISPTGPNAGEVNTVLAALAIAQVPPAPQLTNPNFVGNVGGNTSTVSTGGSFTFTTVNTQTYEIVISFGGTNFDPANTSNRTLTGLALTGTHSVAWDGKDNNGLAFPVGNYKYRIVGRNGEIHFPMLDIEGNVNGGPTLTKLNGSQDSVVYYDDRGYKTANGTAVGTLNGDLCGGATVGPVPSPLFSLLGTDSVTNPSYRTWAGTNNANTDCSSSTQFFGDAKGLDLWAFEKSLQYENPIIIVAPVPGVVDVGTGTTVTPSVVSGATAFGTFVFYNSGADAATGVAYTVSLGTAAMSATCPAAVNFTLVPAGVAATYNPAPACSITFTGMPTTLAPGQSLQFNFNYVVAGSNPGPIPIRTTISATNETAGQPAPNTATAQTVVAKPIVTVTKSADPASGTPVVIGSTITYTLSVNIDSAPLLAQFSMSDTLGAGLTFGSVTNSSPGFACSGSLTCTLPIGTATGTYTVTYTATVNNTAVGTVANNVLPSGGGGDNPPSCTPCSVSHPIPAPKLTILKTASVSPFIVGQAASYTIKVTNTGTMATTAVSTITDVIPTGLTIGTLPAGCTASGQTVTCTIAIGLATGAANAVSVVIPITPTAVASPSVTNTASVFGGGDPACAGAGDCPSSVTTPFAANVSVTKTLTTGGPTAEAGETLTYTVTMNNSGGSAATGVSFAENPGTGLTVNSITPMATPPAGSTVGTCTIGGCTGITVGAGETLTYTVSATVETPLTLTSYTNLVTPTGATCATGACVVVTPTAGAVSVTKTLTTGGPTAEAGETLTYTVTMNNSGGSAATGVSFAENPGTGLTVNSITPMATPPAGSTVGTCTIGGCTGITVGAGETLTYTVSATVETPLTLTSYTNLVTPTGATCATGACVVVTPTAGAVSVTKTLTTGGPTAEAGETLTYTVTMNNSGGSAATGVSFAENPGTGLTVNSITPMATPPAGSTVGTCTIGGCTGITVGAGETLTYTVSATVETPLTLTSYTNLVTPTGATCATGACVVVTPTAGAVSVTKTLTTGGPTAEAGETLTYTVTMNNSGGSAATGVSFAENPGTGLTVNSITPMATPPAGSTVGTCTIGGCTGITVGAGETLTYTVSATVETPLTLTSYTNLVTPTGATCATGACVVVTPTAGAVSVTKALSAESITADGIAEPGEELTYTITVRNDGGTATTNTIVNESVPLNTTFVSGTPVWTCAVGSPGGTACNTLVNLPASVGGQPGVTTLLFTVRVVDPLPSGVTSIANAVTFNDGTPPDCVALPSQAGCVVVQTANVNLTKTVASVTATGPSSYVVIYLIEVANLGGSPATYTLTDTLGFATQGVNFTGNATVTTVGGTVNPALTGGQFTPVNGTVVQLSASNSTVAAGAIHRFAVNVPVGVQPVALQNGVCTGDPGNGFYNAANLSGSFTLQSAACAPVNGDVALIRLIKRVTLGLDANGNRYGDVGDVLDYTFTISNPGTVSLTTVQLFDPRVGNLQCDALTATGAPFRVLLGDELFSSPFDSQPIPGTLIPGDSVDCRASYTLTAVDVARRQVVNSATTTATGPAGQAVTTTATAIYTSFR